MKSKIPQFVLILTLSLISLIFLFGSEEEDIKFSPRDSIHIDGVSYLSMDLSDSIPSDCILIGYISNLNPDSDLYSSMEPSGARVYQNPLKPETVFVERQKNLFCNYTNELALRPVIKYKDSLYILLSNGLTVDGSIPKVSDFTPAEETISFSISEIFPKENMTTNDANLDGEKIYISVEHPSFIYASRFGSTECFAEVSLVKSS